MLTKHKVLIFSLTDLSMLGGGGLFTANFLATVQQIRDVNFSLVSAGYGGAKEANSKFAAALGLDHSFVHLRDTSSTAVIGLATMAQTAAHLVAEKYYFFRERHYRQQRHVDARLAEFVKVFEPDLIIVDGIWSANCAPSIFNLGIPVCFVTHNHETSIHRDFRSHGQRSPTEPDAGSSLELWIAKRFNWLSNFRFERHVAKLYARCAGLIALTNNDVPINLPSHMHCTVLPPLLEGSARRWNYQGCRSLLFVGNAGYFANRLAIEWICGCLAPQLLKIDDSICVNIIGAGTADVSRKLHLPNINFLGSSNKQEVVQHMTSDDLFIAPTAQNYGAKLKLAECASHGMPFVATNSALAGLSFLKSVPEIDLDRPEAAARSILRCIDSPELLRKLSHDMSASTAQARLEQITELDNFIRSLLTRYVSGRGYISDGAPEAPPSLNNH